MKIDVLLSKEFGRNNNPDGIHNCFNDEKMLVTRRPTGM
jgi:hypothetical protein